MRLALGTVQFGLNYGIANQKGQVLLEEAKAIINYAHSVKINTLDTAYLYGESEPVLGEILLDHAANTFNIITKLPPIAHKKINAQHLQTLKLQFHESLLRLKKNSLYGLLLHDGTDLLLNNSNALMDFLFELKSEKKIEKMGVSVYSPEELENILSVMALDMVQIPLNIFDHRFLQTGWLAKLHAQGIEIYTRSLFLQGLLLMPLEQMQNKIPSAHTHLQKFDLFLKSHQLDALTCHLNFIKSIAGITKTLVGVTSVQELVEIVEAYHSTYLMIDYSELATNDLAVIDPRQWQ